MASFFDDININLLGQADRCVVAKDDDWFQRELLNLGLQLNESWQVEVIYYAESSEQSWYVSQYQQIDRWFENSWSSHHRSCRLC